MIRRLYVHNFRCLENFELSIAGQSSVLLIGRNGSGKTAVGLALEVLQKIGRGTNRVDQLVKPTDFTSGRTDLPVRFEIEIELGDKVYSYVVAFVYPEGSDDPRVLEESLKVSREPLYTRMGPTVTLFKTISGDRFTTEFPMDRHLVALPLIHGESPSDSSFVFKQWLARIVMLRPLPALITGDSEGETLEPNAQGTNVGAWFSGILASVPAAYALIKDFLKELLPDLSDVRNLLVGKRSRTLLVDFSTAQASTNILFEQLSDGEKCYMICALVVAANAVYGPLCCYWDEPDNYLALSEVGHFVLSLRKAFESGGQLIATSHNPEAIRRFSDENTFVLARKSHLEPTVIRPLSELHVSGDLVGALVRDDLTP